MMCISTRPENRQFAPFGGPLPGIPNLREERQPTFSFDATHTNSEANNTKQATPSVKHNKMKGPIGRMRVIIAFAALIAASAALVQGLRPPTRTQPKRLHRAGQVINFVFFFFLAVDVLMLIFHCDDSHVLYAMWFTFP